MKIWQLSIALVIAACGAPATRFIDREIDVSTGVDATPGVDASRVEGTDGSIRSANDAADVSVKDAADPVDAADASDASSTVDARDASGDAHATCSRQPAVDLDCQAAFAATYAYHLCSVPPSECSLYHEALDDADYWCCP